MTDCPDKLANRADSTQEMIAEIERLRAEVERCHERLEITHYFQIDDTSDDLEMKRVTEPNWEDRLDLPDGIAARDATISIQDETLREFRDRLLKFEASLTEVLEIAARNEGGDFVKRAREALS